MNEKQEIEVPLTVNFDTQNPIGTARLKISDVELDMLANGKLSLSPAFMVHETSDIAIGVYKEVELIEVSLIPTANYINYLKKHGLYNDNDNTTNGITR